MSKVRRSRPPRHRAKPPMSAASASLPDAASLHELPVPDAIAPGEGDASDEDAVLHARDIAETTAETVPPVEAAITPDLVTMTAQPEAAASPDTPETGGPAVALFEGTAETLADIAETTTECVAEAAPAVPAIPDVGSDADASLVATPRLQAETVGTAVMNYFIAEGEAFTAHMRSLAKARTMAEIVRLQIGEFQRGADAMLSCWGLLTVAAGRTVAVR